MFNQSKAHSGPDEQPATSAGEIAEPCTLLFGEDDDLGDHGEFYEDDAGEGPFESLLRHAADIEAGLMPGWNLDRSHPGALVWTTPSGRRYESTLDGSSYKTVPLTVKPARFRHDGRDSTSSVRRDTERTRVAAPVD
jgi:hypothetical protein